MDTQAITNAAIALLSLVLIGIGFEVGRLVMAKLNELKTQVGADKWTLLETLAKTVIQYVEQLSITGEIENEAEAKLKEAEKQLQALADSHGIKVDVDALRVMIESLILQGWHKAVDPQPVPADPPPAARG